MEGGFKGGFKGGLKEASRETPGGVPQNNLKDLVGEDFKGEFKVGLLLCFYTNL